MCSHLSRMSLYTWEDEGDQMHERVQWYPILKWGILFIWKERTDCLTLELAYDTRIISRACLQPRNIRRRTVLQNLNQHICWDCNHYEIVVMKRPLYSSMPIQLLSLSIALLSVLSLSSTSSLSFPSVIDIIHPTSLFQHTFSCCLMKLT